MIEKHTIVPIFPVLGQEFVDITRRTKNTHLLEGMT